MRRAGGADDGGYGPTPSFFLSVDGANERAAINGFLRRAGKTRRHAARSPPMPSARQVAVRGDPIILLPPLAPRGSSLAPARPRDPRTPRRSPRVRSDDMPLLVPRALAARAPASRPSRGASAPVARRSRPRVSRQRRAAPRRLAPPARRGGGTPRTPPPHGRSRGARARAGAGGPANPDADVIAAAVAEIKIT